MGTGHAPALVDRTEVHAQMSGHPLVLEVGGRDELVRQRLDQARERLLQRPARATVVVFGALARELGAELVGPIGGGHDVTPDRLRQRPQQARDEFGAQPRHLPVEPGVLDLGE